MVCSVTFAADMVPALRGIKKGILLKSGAIPVAVSFVSCKWLVVSSVHYSLLNIHRLNIKPLFYGMEREGVQQQTSQKTCQIKKSYIWAFG